MNLKLYDALFAGRLAHVLPDRLASWLEADSARMKAASSGVATTRTGIAVIPVRGILTLHPVETIFGDFGGRTTLLRRRFDDAMADESVGAIVLDVDSPGGLIDGVPELADHIRSARGSKPIVAVANTLMASAAYWLAAQADEVVATPSAEIGSVGVYVHHIEFTKQFQDAGVKSTILRATNSPRKIEANPFEPLSEEAHDHLIDVIDQAQNQFEKAVAAGRNVKQPDVRENFGGGVLMTARDAVRAGLADRVATIEQTIAGLVKKPRQTRRRRSSLAFI